MTDNYERLIKLLKELFMIDRPDLDFGIYRIMNQKRDEITKFLDKDLLPQVKESFAAYGSGGHKDIQAQLDEAIKQAQTLGANPDDLPKVKELKEKLEAAVDVTDLENEVYSHLYNFFRRYYSDGDFLSLRRYKKDVYAIPYEGEEVKLHWANADQYYIKSSENFRDYTFKLGELPADGEEDTRKTVHLKLVEADTEVANVKEQQGKERRFVLCENSPLVEESGELFIRFEYKTLSKQKTQKKLNEEALKTILESTDHVEWVRALAKEENGISLLSKHLNSYAAKNSFDYFIHKDLGGFFRRELDFFIKNEVMHLDDIEEESVPRVELYLSQIKVLRSIAHKLIRFVEQLENYQKKMWLKKKFVIQTDYCLTLDYVPEDLYPDVCANEEQRKEWIELFAIDKIKGDMTKEGYSEPLSVEFLKENPSLVLDTKFFSNTFKSQLLAEIDGLDEKSEGLLIHSDNFQALNTIQTRYEGKSKCVYIDPPYNTNSSSIPYKNGYKSSSWGTLIRDRLELLNRLMSNDGAIYVSIDKTERTILEYALDTVFGLDNRVEELIWAMNTNNSQAPNYSTNHEYVQVYAKNRIVAEQDKSMFREPKPGYQEVMDLIEELNPSFPPIKEIEASVKKLHQDHLIELRSKIDEAGLDWNTEKKNDPWKGLYNYSRAEYRDKGGQLISEKDARMTSADIWVWREDNSSMPATKQAASTQDPTHPNWRFYKPIHPLTGKPAPHPKSGWKFAFGSDETPTGKRSFTSLDRDHRIAWGKDHNKIPQIKRMLHEVETNIGKSVFSDYSDGEKQTSALFGKSGVFLSPKHSSFVSRFINHAAKDDSLIIDCFGGSGSTGQAVIDVNRLDQGQRKYVLIEMGAHFDTVLKPRIQKVIYSKEWKAGKPALRKGSSHMFKYMSLESYEDTLNNLEYKRSEQQGSLLSSTPALKEEYMLSYMMDMETEGSTSLLNVDRFDDPWNYTMKIATGSAGETKTRPVDLVETFNYLIGLTVIRRDFIRGIEVIEGTSPDGDNVLVIWRNTNETNNEQLDEFFRKQDYNTRDTEFDLIYVNGDNNLENLRRPDQTWKVRLIEDDFKQLMFDVEDV